MKALIAFSLLLGSLVPKPVLAEDLMWVDLIGRLTYQDGSRSCSYKPGLVISDPFQLMARVDSAGKLIHAEFRMGIYFLRRYLFTPAERAQVMVEKDALGEYFVKSMTLDARTLNWLFFNITNSCRPSRTLATLGPQQGAFTFAPITADAYRSGSVNFKGTLSNGNEEYAIELGFLQKMPDKPLLF